jgi:hypothetical protein
MFTNSLLPLETDQQTKKLQPIHKSIAYYAHKAVPAEKKNAKALIGQ